MKVRTIDGKIGCTRAEYIGGRWSYEVTFEDGTRHAYLGWQLTPVEDESDYTPELLAMTKWFNKPEDRDWFVVHEQDDWWVFSHGLTRHEALALAAERRARAFKWSEGLKG